MKISTISRRLERRFHVRQVSDAGVMVSDERHGIESGSGEIADIEGRHERIRHVECFLGYRGCCRTHQDVSSRCGHAK